MDKSDSSKLFGRNENNDKRSKYTTGTRGLPKSKSREKQEEIFLKSEKETVFKNENLVFSGKNLVDEPPLLHNLYQELYDHYNKFAKSDKHIWFNAKAKKETNNIILCFNKLSEYAINNTIIPGSAYGTFNIDLILTSLISPDYDIKLRESVLYFISVAFSHEALSFIISLKECGFISLLKDIVQEKNFSLSFLIFNILTSISDEGEALRDEILNRFTLNTLNEYLFNYRFSFKVKEQILILLEACCQYKYSKEKSTDVFQFIKNCFYSLPQNLMLHLFYMLDNFCVHENGINEVLSDKVFLDELFSYSLKESMMQLYSLQSISIIIEKSNHVPLNYFQLIDLITKNKNEDITLQAMRLFSNAIINDEEFTGLEIQDFKNVLKLIESKSQIRYESIILICTIIRCSQDSKNADIIFDEEINVVENLVRSLEIANPEMVEAVLSTLAKFLDRKDPTVQEKMDNACANDIIEDLIQSDNEIISELAIIFNDTYFEEKEERKPFVFNIESLKKM